MVKKLNFKRKSQTSFEFGLILSLVLVSILIAVAAFDLFPSTADNLRRQNEMEGLREMDIGILNYNFDSTTVDLLIINNFEYPISITSIAVGEGTVNVTIPLNPGQRANTSVTGVSVFPGQYYTEFAYTNLENSGNYKTQGNAYLERLD